VKNPSEFKVIGKPVLHRDAPEKVTGKAKFVGDIRLPDMLYAKVLRPPAHGAKLKSVDTAAAEKLRVRWSAMVTLRGSARTRTGGSPVKSRRVRRRRDGPTHREWASRRLGRS
jgi:CO/xanthine dehydrogenase Mo-binding subunit